MAVIGLAVISLVPLSWAHVAALPRLDLIGLTTLIILGVIAEALAYSYKVGNNQATSSVAFVPVLSSIVIFSPVEAVLTALLIVGITELGVAKKALWKAAFNICQIIIATVLAAMLWTAFATGNRYTDLLIFLLCSTIFFLTNQALVSGFIALAQESPFFWALRQIIGGTGSNLLFDVLVSPIALVVALFYNDYGPWGLLVTALPLLLVRHAYLSKHQVQRANKDLLRVLIKAIETRDPYTSGHSVRVSVLARTMAEDLGVSRHRLDALETAALLHDIGKIDGIYARIISKPYSLDSDERAIIRTHAVKGAEFLRSLSSFSDTIIEGVKHHHERFDGTGYPDGLRGEHIPLAARIIMICDAIDAMLSDRPYRKALGIPTVLTELEKHAGTQFDPRIVAAVRANGTLSRAVDLISEWESPISGPVLRPTHTSVAQVATS